MSVRSLNKVMLIGNLTRDPELRYTPAGTAVVSMGLATNRSWTTESGEKKEETEFHRIVAWNKLAELCSQLLAKGRKIYVEGRLQTRTWTGSDGNQRTTTEIVIDDMIILDSRRMESGEGGSGGASSFGNTSPQPSATSQAVSAQLAAVAPVPRTDDGQAVKPTDEAPKTANEDINPDDIPF